MRNAKRELLGCCGEVAFFGISELGAMVSVNCQLGNGAFHSFRAPLAEYFKKPSGYHFGDFSARRSSRNPEKYPKKRHLPAQSTTSHRFRVPIKRRYVHENTLLRVTVTCTDKVGCWPLYFFPRHRATRINSKHTEPLPPVGVHRKLIHFNPEVRKRLFTPTGGLALPRARAQPALRARVLVVR